MSPIGQKRTSVHIVNPKFVRRILKGTCFVMAGYVGTLLSGCTPRVAESHAFGVTITRPAYASYEDVQKLAAAECAKHGGKAVFQRVTRKQYVFTC